MIPLLAEVRIQRQDGRRHRLWLPLPVLWPPAIVLFAITEILALLGCLGFLFIRPRYALAIALAPPTVAHLLLQTAGLRMELARSDQIEVQVHIS